MYYEITFPDLIFPSNGFLEIDSDEHFGGNSGMFEATKVPHVQMARRRDFYIFGKGNFGGPEMSSTYPIAYFTWYYGKKHMKQHSQYIVCN